jgi:hypothetical protein
VELVVLTFALAFTSIYGLGSAHIDRVLRNHGTDYSKRTTAKIRDITLP